MDPITAEITKAALSELGKEAAPLAKTTENFIQKLLGPSADEIGAMWAEKIRLKRMGNSLKIAERARKMLEDANIEPKAVPLKNLVPLLEGASLEEDETLQEQWAALLANSASSEEDEVLPSFLYVLRQMSPDEAQFFQNLSKDTTYIRRWRGGNQEMEEHYEDRLLKQNDTLEPKARIWLDSLVRAGLLRYRNRGEHGTFIGVDNGPFIAVTEYGKAFIKACQFPIEKSETKEATTK